MNFAKLFSNGEGAAAKTKTLKIAEDFSRTPFGRYRSDGGASAEAFRDDLLVPKIQEAMDNGEKLVVSFDGLEELGPAFLNEVFAGMIHKKIYTSEQLHDAIDLQPVESFFAPYIRVTWECIDGRIPYYG